MTDACPDQPAPGRAADQSLPAASRVVDLPNGRKLDLLRSRWDGPLDPEELAYCREHGIELAYDCAQIGWVPANCVDESSFEPGPERVASLARYTSPEQDGLRLRRVISSHAARVVAEAATATQAAEQIALLRASLTPRIADFYARYGVHAANRCHPSRRR